MTAPDPFAFLRSGARDGKPRRRGVTEIRGPYYSMLGERALADLLDAYGGYVDALKFAGGSFVPMRADALRAIIDLCHDHDVRVCTGGFLEHVLTRGPEAVDRYLGACKEAGFDTVEVSTGFLAVADEDVVRLVERVRKHGLVARAEVGVQLGAGGDTPADELAREERVDASRAVRLARRCLDAGAEHVLLESEGVTENVREWRTDVPQRLADAVGLDRVRFEAADPRVFAWYVKTFGPDVNLFVDHSQLVQLECLRQGLWGPASLWGRVASYRP